MRKGKKIVLLLFIDYIMTGICLILFILFLTRVEEMSIKKSITIGLVLLVLTVINAKNLSNSIGRYDRFISKRKIKIARKILKQKASERLQAYNKSLQNQQ